ncbi:uncharacterized protein N7469_005878 [Penicillium citrinum]|uniref:Uncharacterized protein n=1 Tax=Penicillium citrinum TaxID=5077 RepID=A0A9W9NX79_PENCI|nr:uncharacterized protein N7469_005878 [Penicillium citrinum]KAJ5231290.1 hypothetical protein N7469_005878 [Penicillium citrinum]
MAQMGGSHTYCPLQVVAPRLGRLRAVQPGSSIVNMGEVLMAVNCEGVSKTNRRRDTAGSTLPVEAMHISEAWFFFDE